MHKAIGYILLVIVVLACVLHLFQNVLAWDKMDYNTIVDDRVRLVRLDTDLTMELLDGEPYLQLEADRLNLLRKRKHCVQIKQEMYSNGASLEEVSAFVCPDDYQKIEINFTK